MSTMLDHTVLHTTPWFAVELRAHESILDPEDDLEEWHVEAIRAGRFLWFDAEVVVTGAGSELGFAGVAGCCYESLDDFRRNSGGMLNDLVGDAVAEARATIRALAAVPLRA